MKMPKIKISDLKKFDVAELLDSEEAIAEYLNAALEDDDPAFLITAIGDIARAQGIAKIAEKTGLGRESLYKSFREDASPKFDTVQRVMTAMGFKLTVEPATKESEAA
jgi:probable addiction module antidote protein